MSLGNPRKALTASSHDRPRTEFSAPTGHGAPGFFFFPFGLLFFVLVLVLVFSVFRRGRRGGPWRYGGGGAAWLENWHRRAHERDATDAGSAGSA